MRQLGLLLWGFVHFELKSWFPVVVSFCLDHNEKKTKDQSPTSKHQNNHCCPFSGRFWWGKSEWSFENAPPFCSGFVTPEVVVYMSQELQDFTELCWVVDISCLPAAALAVKQKASFHILFYLCLWGFSLSGCYFDSILINDNFFMFLENHPFLESRVLWKLVTSASTAVAEVTHPRKRTRKNTRQSLDDLWAIKTGSRWLVSAISDRGHIHRKSTGNFKLEVFKRVSP